MLLACDIPPARGFLICLLLSVFSTLLVRCEWTASQLPIQSLGRHNRHKRGLLQDAISSSGDRDNAAVGHLRGEHFERRPAIVLPSAAGHAGALPGCQNSRQGRHLVVDDEGFVCSRAAFNGTTGCCQEQREPHRFSCSSCDLERHCCSQYEYCVACCMDPDKTSLEEALAAPIAHQPTEKPFETVFDLCLSRCRSNSQSVVHENAYKSELHHCYSLPAVNGSSGDAEQFKAEVSNPGQSCKDACAERNMLCVPAALRTINTCEWLKQFFTCDGGCSTSMGVDQPAEVVDDAPPHQRPGACLVNSNEDMLSCEGQHPITRRLCPCASVI